MELRKAAFVGAKWTAVSSVLVAALQFIQIAVLARFLLPSDFGVMALVIVVLGFFQTYADMGISSAIVHRQNITREQLSSLFWLNAVVGFGMFLALAACAPHIAEAYGAPDLELLTRLAAFALLIAPISQQLSTLLQKELRFGAMATADLISTAAGAGIAIVLAYNGVGVQSLVWGQLGGSAARTLVLVRLVFPNWRPMFRLRKKDLAGYVRFGAFQMGERTVNFLGANLDKLLIGSMLGTHALGLYSVAYQLVMKPMQVVNPVVTRVAFPLFAKVQNDNPRLRSGYLDAIRVIATVSFPLYVGIIVLARPFTTAVLGPGWAATVPTLQILCVLALFYSLGNPLGSLLLAKGRVDLGLYLNIWRTLLFAMSIPVGVMWGTGGVAAALVCATAACLFPVGFWVRWLLVQMRSLEYLAAFSPALAAALLMGAAVVGARSMGIRLVNASAELVVLGTLGALVYLIIILTWQRGFFRRVAETLK